jgi:hypothetical protein
MDAISFPFLILRAKKGFRHLVVISKILLQSAVRTSLQDRHLVFDIHDITQEKAVEFRIEKSVSFLFLIVDYNAQSLDFGPEND